MDNCKYIVVDHPTYDETIIMFPCHFVHADMARLVGGPVLGAGFVRFGAETQGIGDNPDIRPTVECYGESVSLKVKSRERDTQLAQRLLTGY